MKTPSLLKRLFSALLFGMVLPMASATDSNLDSAFTAITSPGITPDGYPTWNNGTGAVNAVALQSTGKIVIGGNLSRYQSPAAGSPTSSLKRLNADGSLDTAFGTIASTLTDSQGDTEVNKILGTSGDKIYVGGVFTSYQGTSRSGIMRLNADGTLDTGFNLGGVSNTVSFGTRYVLAIAEQTDGKVLVGGAFNRLTSGSVFVANNLFRADSNGARDTAFCDNVNTSLANSSFVGDLAVLPDGKILVAGGLNKVGGGSTPLLVRLNADGTTDTSFSVAFGTDYGDIDELLVLPDGRILIGGDVSFAATGTPYYFACLNSDGTFNTAFMNNVGSGPGGWAGGEITLQPDGTILVGGIFFQWNNQPRASIARLNPDGTLDGGLNIPPYSTTPGLYGTHIYSMAVQPDGKLVAGGWFNCITDTAVETYNLVRFTNEYAPTEPGTIRAVSATITTAENAGSVSVPVSRFGGLTGAVSVSYSITPVNAVPNTDYTAVSGSLSWAAGEGGVKNISIPILQDTAQDGPRLFTVNLTGSTGGAFLPPSADETVVTIRDDDAAPLIVTAPVAVSVEQGAKFVVGILYDSVLPATVQWQRDSGSGYVNIPGATSISYTVSAADSATHTGSYRAIVTNANGSTTSTGAAVSISVPAGSLVTSFAPTGLIINNAAQNLTIDSAGRYLVASASQIRRLNPDGTYDSTNSFGINVSSINSVLHLANGYTYVGGSFGTITHTPSGATSTVSSRLFRLNNNATATIDTLWSYAVNGTGGVTALAPGSGGTLYVGSANAATSTNGIQRVKADGLNDTSWAPATNTIAAGSGGTVVLIKELADGKVLVSHRHGSSSTGTYRLSRLTSTGALDTTFGTSGNIDFGTSNWVNGLDVLPDGRIAVSGRFNMDFFTPGQRYLAILNADGTPDTSFQFGSAMLNGNPNGVIYRDGRLFVWGGFTTVNGSPQAGVMRVNLDGSVDGTFSAGVGVAGGTPVVNSAKFTSTGEIFIAGNFTSYKGVTRNYTALLAGNPQVGTIGFAPPRVTTLEEAAPLTLTLKRYGDTTQAISIDWTTANGTATAGVDYTAASGTVSWAAGDIADKAITVNKLENSVIHANRVFTIALSNPSGPVGAGAPATITLIDDDTPLLFTAQPSSTTSLLSGGTLNLTATTSSPSPTTYQWFRNGVAIAGATTTSFSKSNLTMADAGVYTLVATNAAGSVTSTPSLVVVSAQPGRPTAGQATSGRPVFNSAPVGIAVANDGSVYVGGSFTANAPNNVPQSFLIRVKPDGSTDTAYTYTPGGAITALARQSDGKILIAGSFTNRVIRLNADGSNDSTFSTALGASLNASGQVNDFAFDSTGRIYVGGASYISRLSSAGVFDATYAPAVNNSVTAIAIQNDDKLIAGGSFSSLAGSAAGRLGRLNTDGTRDTAFVSGIGGSGTYNDLLVLTDGRILVVGSNFSNGANYALVNADGSFGSNIGSSGVVYQLAQAPGGKVVNISSFSTFVNRLKATNPLPSPGSSDFDSTFNVGTGPNTEARALAIATDGGIWIAGLFTSVNGVATGGIAKLNGDPLNPAIVNQPTSTGVAPGNTAYLGVGASGTGLTYQWLKNGSPLANGGNISGVTTAVLAIANASVDDDADYTVEVTSGATTITSSSAHLYVLGAPLVVSQPAAATPALGSTFSLTAGVYAANPATYTWTRDGVPIINGGRYSGATTPSLAITGVNAVDNGNYTLTVTNSLGTINTTAATIAVASVPATRDPSAALTALGTSTNPVNAFLHLPDGRTLIGSDSGVVGTGGANVSSGLAVVDTAGVPALTAAGVFNGSVQAILRQPDGKILVAGGFTTIAGTGGNGRVRIARLNADLTVDATFNPAQPSNTVFRLALDSADRIYLQGSFLNLDGQTGYSNLVRLRADGSLDLSFNPSIGGSVLSMLMMPDDSLLVGGSITAYSHGGVLTTINGLVRIAPSGSVASGFTSGLPANSSVQAIDLDSTGRIALLVNVAGSGSVYRMENNGSLVAEFSSPVVFNNFCRSVVALPSGGFLVGGDFTSPSARLARINADGTLDTTFNIGTGFSVTSGTQPTVNVIAPDALGRLWIGGSRFTSYNGSAANRLVVLQGEGSSAFAISQQPGGKTVDVGTTTVSFTVGVAANNGFTFQWRRAGQPLADGGRISGATTSTLTIANVLTSDAQLYDVVVTKPNGATTTASLTSNTAPLTVLSTPEILSSPTSLTREIGASATLTALARGAGTLTYQWLLNGSPLANGTWGGVTISGATSQSLTVSGLGFAQAGSYRLRVTNILGEVTSSAAVLTVERRPGSLAPGIGNPTANNSVLAILRLADGSMLVGGQFTSITVNGVVNNRNRLARFLTDGTLDPSFTPTFNGDVRSLAQDSAGNIFVGGNFTQVTFGSTTTNRTRVARLTSALVLDTAFDTSTAGPNAQINAVAPTGDGGVYVGGAFGFNLVGATTVNRVARLSPTGALDTGFSVLTSVITNEVKALLRRNDGKLYAGGTFGTVLLESTGTKDTAFAAAAPSILAVQGQSMLQLTSGELVLGASGGSPIPYLRRLIANTGASLTDFASGHASMVSALAVQADGKVLSGSIGSFKRSNPLTGADDTGFASFDSTISALAVDGAGRIWAGGSFTTYNGVAQARLAVLTGGEFESQSGPLNPQTITFPAIADKTTLDEPFVLNATSDSGLPVSYQISGPANLSGSTVTLTGATGLVTITATQAGNATTSAATPVVRTFTVNAAPPLQTFLANAGVPANKRGPNDDPDNDGISNLIEYGLGLAPNTPDAAAMPEGVSNGTHLTITYRRAQPGLAYVVETSPTLTGGSWTSVGVDQGTPDGNGWTTASIPLGSNAAFLRIAVTSTP